MIRAGVILGVGVLLALGTFKALEAFDASEGKVYQASANPLADVEAGLERARQNDRLLLVVLGANWCHDSRALGQRLFEEPLAGTLDDHYERVIVDVGYLEHGRDVAQRFGVPNYYATPTVLIVDPATETLVNAFNRHQWGQAYDITMADTQRYFSAFVEQTFDPVPPPDELEREIQAYEAQLANRVADAYLTVGPALRAYKDDDSSKDQFEPMWDELAEFRRAIPATMAQMREQADAIRKTTEKGPLKFPELPRFSWEG